MLHRIIIICHFFFLSVVLFAQKNEKQYQFRRIDITKGLSHNQVNCILKDSRGFMWFGTMSGLNRYDGYQYKIFKHNPKDLSSIGDDYITKIVELPNGELLVQTSNMGFNIYDPITEKFSHDAIGFQKKFSLPSYNITSIDKNNNGDFYFLIPQQGLFKYSSQSKKTTLIPGLKNNIVAFVKDSKGDFWVVHNNGALEKLDGNNDRVSFSTDALTKQTNGVTSNYGMAIDNEDELWIYAATNLKGLFYFRPSLNQLLNINKDNSNPRLNTNLVVGVLQDNKSNIWICTDHGGINILDKKKMTINYVVNNLEDKNSLSQNSIRSIYKDNTGIIWVGTYKKGINCYHENIIEFPLYRHQLTNAKSLPYDDVNRFLEDAKGNIWIGTNGGGLIYFDRANEKFAQFRHQAANPNSLTNDVIVSLCLDKQQKLWIGTYLGGLDCFDGTSFIHYRNNPSDSNSIANNSVWEIFEDTKSNLWIGTLGGGLDRFDRDKKIFYHYTATSGKTIYSNFISDLAEDKDGNLWIGTATGIDILEKQSGNFFHYNYDVSNELGLSNGNVLSIFMDGENRVWVGTRDGLNLFNKTNKRFYHFNTQDGLPDNTILEILEDKPNNLWVSTPNGISNISVSNSTAGKDVVSINCKNYDESDGLQGMEFNQNASLKTKKGELIFGGANGFNIFQPQNIQGNKTAPKLVFTDFQLFNTTINPGETVNGHVLLPQAIGQTQSITLNHDQNAITIQFAALDFSNADKIKYSYKLEGFKNEWLVADAKTRKAIFTNLDPGDYTFYVKTANGNGEWNSDAIKLDIKILPPFWKSTLAYVVYFLMIVIALYIGRLMIIKKARVKFKLEQERLEAHRMHELDLMKIKFFTNVSHEFRTPLSLILTPLDKILKQTAESPQKQQLHLIHRNARRLLNLVNQLLDFRKLEERELKLHTKQGDIIKYVSDVSHFFSDVADKKNISFSFHSNIESLFIHFDHDKIERILFNLLSNAFKFTLEHGQISVDVVAKENGGDRYELMINVQDTGIGIEQANQEKIFERFFQNDVPGSMVNQGSGIGLAITKEFVKLHGGTIRVESEPNKGSCFIVSLPVIAVPKDILPNNKEDNKKVEADLDNEILDNELMLEIVEPQNINKDKPKNTGKKPMVLLVEDNNDFRFYLKDNLKEYFDIVEAADGKQGWQKALAAHPDLIVSDVTMPEMDGVAMCKKIKTDKRTKHIPIILLTAVIGDEQQIKGLETGANDYMTKPFNFEILLFKIKNQLSQKEQIKKTYAKRIEVSPGDIVVDSADEIFMQKLLALVEKNISEPDFSVDEMSRGMFVSRVSLYKRIFSLTGQTPVEFIRQIRLKRAVQLFEKSNMTIAEVAFEVGFNGRKYFSKYFKTQYGKTPSDFVDELRKNEVSDNSIDVV